MMEETLHTGPAIVQAVGIVHDQHAAEQTAGTYQLKQTGNRSDGRQQAENTLCRRQYIDCRGSRVSRHKLPCSQPALWDAATRQRRQSTVHQQTDAVTQAASSIALCSIMPLAAAGTTQAQCTSSLL